MNMESASSPVNYVGVLGGRDAITVYSCNKMNKDSKSHGKASHLLSIKKNSWLYEKFPRKLVNQSLGIFLSLQKAVQNCDGDVTHILLKKSREYRSIIQACMTEMHEYIEKEKEENKLELKESCELLYKMELILGLVEILFIDAQPGSFIMDHLLQWIRLHFPQPKQDMAECLSAAQPHTHPKYWDAMYGLVLQGLTNEARTLLSEHPESHTDPFLSIDELLRKMPFYQTYSGISGPEFNVRWVYWKSECESRLKKEEFSNEPQLQKICQILSGSTEVLVEMIDVLDTWYHLMVSRLLYTNPSVMAHRLPAAAQEAIGIFDADILVGSLDELLLHVIEINQKQVLRNCQMVLDNLWFTVHLADLLHHSMKSKNQAQAVQDLEMLRESLLLDFSLELGCHKSLWQVSLNYLDVINTVESKRAAEIILEKQPVTSEQKALKIVQAAKVRGMDAVANGVCRVVGKKTMGRGQMGSAMWWSIRSQDSVLTSHLAHEILHQYLREGKFDSTTLLDNLGPSMLLSDTLTFLSKYKEFHSLYQSNQVKEAANLLVSLITSKMAPKYFWPVLLEDSLPLLDYEEVLVSVDQTYDLLYCLHNVTLDEEIKKPCPEILEKEWSFAEKEADIRMALTNNLARAIVSEGTK